MDGNAVERRSLKRFMWAAFTIKYWQQVIGHNNSIPQIQTDYGYDYDGISNAPPIGLQLRPMAHDIVHLTENA